MNGAHRRPVRSLLWLALLACSSLSTLAHDSNAPVEHVVIVWLQEPGNAQQRTNIIEQSQALTAIPGVLSLKSGRVVKSERAIVDSSFDVALVISLESQAALDAYLVHPIHVKLVEETLKPLVERIQVYDFR